MSPVLGTKTALAVPESPPLSPRLGPREAREQDLRKRRRVVILEDYVVVGNDQETLPPLEPETQAMDISVIP